jgi:DNA-binding NarL/FixJ family response regulator
VRPVPRILVADGHAATRVGVRRSLEADGFEVVGEAADHDTAVRQALELQPDACLLDVQMPGGGNAAAAKIVRALPDTRVVMLSSSSAEDDLFDALRAGASGYLLKETDPERLPFALRGVLQGEAALPRVLTARLIQEFRAREHRRRGLSLSGRQVQLSDREWEVLDLMRDGRSTREIGDRLTISPVTVRRHIQALLQKMQVPGRREALALLEG